MIHRLEDDQSGEMLPRRKIVKAQVLYEYDPSMQRPVWVEEAECPPQVETASDVVVKIGAAGVCRADLHC